MKIWEADALPLFLMFVVPGFLSLKVYDLLVPGERRDFTKALPEAISFSALNFSFFFPVYAILPIDFANYYPVRFLVFLVLVFLIAPVLWPIVWLRISRIGFLARHLRSPIPKPWDWLFGKTESYWVIVHLTDGGKIGGRFDTRSFASDFPEEEQLYLEEVWNLDETGVFVSRVDRTRGILILSKDISSVELFE